MKIRDILLEVTNRVRPLLVKIAAKNNLDTSAAELFEKSIDSITENPNYQQWLAQQLVSYSYQNPAMDIDDWAKFFNSKNWLDLKSALDNFLSQKDKLSEKNINKYSMSEVLDKFSDENFKVFGEVSSTLLRIDPRQLDGVKLVKSVGGVKTYEVSQANSLAELGRGSKWCTRAGYKECRAEYYIDTYGITFVATVNGRLVSQWTPLAGQVKDINNDDLNVVKYGSQLYHCDGAASVVIDYLKRGLENSFEAFTLYIRDMLPGKDSLVESFLEDSMADIKNLSKDYSKMILDLCILYSNKISARWAQLEGLLTGIQTYNYNNLAFLYDAISGYSAAHDWPEANSVMYIVRDRLRQSSPYYYDFSFKVVPETYEYAGKSVETFAFDVGFNVEDGNVTDFDVIDFDAFDASNNRIAFSAYESVQVKRILLEEYESLILETVYDALANDSIEL